MKFTPKSEEQIKQDQIRRQEERLLAAGECDFEVIGADEQFNEKNKCDMFILTLRIWDKNGKESTLKDWILNNDQFEWKLRHFCHSAGLEDYYETGDLSTYYMRGKTGKLMLSVRKDKKGKFPDQNAVDDYILATEREPDFIDDDLDHLVPVGQ